MEQGPTTMIRRSSRPCSTSAISVRLRSTSVWISSETGSSSCNSAGEINGRTAAMRVSSMRVMSWVESAAPTSRVQGIVNAGGSSVP